MAACSNLIPIHAAEGQLQAAEIAASMLDA